MLRGGFSADFLRLPRWGHLCRSCTVSFLRQGGQVPCSQAPDTVLELTRELQSLLRDVTGTIWAIVQSGIRPRQTALA